jgi:FAD/FMN-containing dehydrogenase
MYPGALQWENWESWPEEDEQCYVETDQSTPCKQGRISLFSVIAQTAEHIQTAVKFAAHHNIKLVIKNTGHDFLGRSSAPHSLQILTHGFKNISVVDGFVPRMPAGTATSEKIKAVTLGAGVQLREMYAYLGSKGLMVVGGASNTVGVAGGYVQGGGHSYLGWMHGMASDNVLEFQVVLADVRLPEWQFSKDIAWFLTLRLC